MGDQKFRYVSYIETTPDELWEALTSANFTRRYWMGNEVESDWNVGSSVKFSKSDGSVILLGTVLVSEKPKILSYTWSFQRDQEMQAEKPSRVSFLLERLAPTPEIVKLTVTHDSFPENSKSFTGISDGWPIVLSCLKTLLETKREIHFSCP